MLVATKTRDVSPGRPYYPVERMIELHKTESQYGKQFYLTSGEHICRFWITDEAAQHWLKGNI